MKQKKNIIYDISLTALFTAVIVVCSWISVSFSAVPFTLHTLGVFTAVAVLGLRRGTVAVGFYIILGLIGLPVFHSFQGGFGVLIGSTGGFIIGLFFSAIIIGVFNFKQAKSLIRLIISLCIGQVAVYICGVLWFVFVYGNSASFGAVLLTTVVPFIIPDILKIFLSAVISTRVSKYVK